MLHTKGTISTGSVDMTAGSDEETTRSTQNIKPHMRKHQETELRRIEQLKQFAAARQAILKEHGPELNAHTVVLPATDALDAGMLRNLEDEYEEARLAQIKREEEIRASELQHFAALARMDAKVPRSSPMVPASPLDTLSDYTTREVVVSRTARRDAIMDTSRMETITRKHEEDFLREPTGSERPCCRGHDCMGLKIPLNPTRVRGAATDTVFYTPFVPREFYTYDEMLNIQLVNRWPSERRTCLLCKRYNEAALFISAKSSGKEVASDIFIQRTVNLFEVADEYSASQALANDTKRNLGVVTAILPLYLDAFEIELVDGVRHYRQTKYTKPNEVSAPVFQ